jgi:two-component system cell cycle sensor histidine kinase/response regulator CckA
MGERSSIHTLLVEPVSESCTLTLAALERRGHHVRLAETAERALEIWLDRPADLVIAAWELPGLDGPELCERLRGLDGGDRAVVLLRGELPDDVEQDRALEVGVSDFLPGALSARQLSVRLAVAERQHLQLARAHRAEAALRRRERDFREMIEALPDCVLIHRGGRLVYANPALCAATERSPESLGGVDCLTLFHPEDRARAVAWLGGAPDPAPSLDLRLRAPDGGDLTVEASPSRRVIFEGSRCRILTFRDVTEQRRAGARLAATERMASVGTLAAGVAHGINNPLAFIIGNLSVLRQDLGDLCRSGGGATLADLLAWQEMVEETWGGVERVRVLVKDLKSFSARRDDDGEYVQFNALLDSTLQLAGNELRYRAQVERRYSDVPPVRASRDHLAQVALNLLINAARAIPVGQVADHHITVRTALAGGRVLLEIADTGCGIPADLMDQIFDPFFTTRAQGEGAGMGLSVCHGLVEGMGGRIEVHSVEGAGTSVRVFLPPADIGARPALTLVRPRASGEVPGGLRVLVIDDEPALGRLLARELSSHRVTVTDSGREAIDICAGSSFDVIFCDLMMPEISGMDFHDALKSRRPGDEARIVFMTGGAFTSRAKRFLEVVENPCLEKPFRSQQIHEALQQVLMSEAALGVQ